MSDLRESRFLKACRREPVDATPVWLMRQAGRYMPEYRALRETFGILDLIRQPELAVEVTMQPIDAFDLDAAIIFADILPLLAGMGLRLEFVKGEGPIIHDPIRTSEDVERLQVVPPEEGVPFTLEAVALARRELDGRGIPLIGFSGAPFTLASYAIEGGGSKNHIHVKRMLMGEPDAWHALMMKLTQAVGEYLLAQARAGAHALQLFDSWCGQLSPQDYRQFVLPFTRKVVEMVKPAGVPVIHFGVGTAGLLEAIAETDSEVIGVDWRIDVDAAWERIGTDRAIQGNLDPVALFAPWEGVQPRIDDVLRRAGGRTGHIFNLGHGILPQTPVETVKRMVEYVHEASARS
jgi:uroporphyrinogen decarboxylase